GAILPAIAVLTYFSEPIVRILFQRGAFGESATHLVSTVQNWSLLQVPFAVFLALGIRITSGLRANRILYSVAALNLGLTLVLDALMMRWQGVAGIPLAGAVVRLVSALYLSCKIYDLYRARTGFKPGDGLT